MKDKQICFTLHFEETFPFGEVGAERFTIKSFSIYQNNELIINIIKNYFNSSFIFSSTREILHVVE